MKFMLIILTLATFNLFAASCNETSLTSLQRMDPEIEYCTDELVKETAIDLYIGRGDIEKAQAYTPKASSIYGDNDDSTLLVVKARNGKAKYIRYKIEYGRCNIISCSDSGYYRDEI